MFDNLITPLEKAVELFSELTFRGSNEALILLNEQREGLAEGGLAYAPTKAIVGDNRNAQVDPEVIAPLSKLKSMLAPTNNVLGENKLTIEVVPINVDGTKAYSEIKNYEFYLNSQNTDKKLNIKTNFGRT
jgi:hypothetical protein